MFSQRNIHERMLFIAGSWRRPWCLNLKAIRIGSCCYEQRWNRIVQHWAIGARSVCQR